MDSLSLWLIGVFVVIAYMVHRHYRDHPDYDLETAIDRTFAELSFPLRDGRTLSGKEVTVLQKPRFNSLHISLNGQEQGMAADGFLYCAGPDGHFRTTGSGWLIFLKPLRASARCACGFLKQTFVCLKAPGGTQRNPGSEATNGRASPQGEHQRCESGYFSPVRVPMRWGCIGALCFSLGGAVRELAAVGTLRDLALCLGGLGEVLPLTP